VLLTGYANLATEEKRVEHGFDGVLAKPYVLETLEEAITRALKAQKPA
jgi:ActR/RegA family two-component response regulator